MHTTASSGGVDRYFHGLGAALADEKVPFKAFAFESEASPPIPWLKSLGPAQVPLLRRWKSIRRVVRQNAGDGPTIVASHFALYALPLSYGMPRMRHIVHFHGPWAEESAAEGQSRMTVAGKWLIEKLVYRKAHHFIVLSQAFADILHANYQIPPSRISIIPGGIELERFSTPWDRASARIKLGWPSEGFIFLCVRRLARRMGLENLIEAFAQIAGRHPQSHLYLVGKGPLAKELQVKCDAAGLGSRIRLLGFVPDAELPLVYRAADLTLMPSQALEGFGLVTLESLACGTPALVTPVGGLPEVLRPFSSHLVFASATTASIAAGLEEVLIGQRPLPSADACRQYAEAFAWPIIAQKIRHVYMAGKA